MAALRLLADEGVTTPDGVRLATDVFLSADRAAQPAVLVRTPYGRKNPFYLRLASGLGRAGLAVVLQDCRGRFGSTGQLDWLAEETDAVTTLAWLARQSWSNGRAALFGVSISSLACFGAAARRPPGVEIAGMVNLAGVLDLHSVFYRGGALVLHWALPWLSMMESGTAAPRPPTGRTWREALAERPLVDALDPAWRVARRVFEDAAGEDPRWRELDRSAQAATLPIPILSAVGWNDFLLDQVLRLAAARPRERHPEDPLVIGPWDHQSLLDRYFEPLAEEGGASLAAWIERWLAACLLAPAPPTPPWMGAARVRYATLPHGRWRAADDPPSPAREGRLFLEAPPGGAPRTVGRLAAERSASPRRATLRADPASPQPARGGRVWPFAAIGLAAGGGRRAADPPTPDRLVFEGPPLERELLLVGPARATLEVFSDAPSFDLMATLLDVDPAGLVAPITDGVHRQRAAAAPGAAGRRVELALGAVAYELTRGHRLRLEITGSEFPRYDRNGHDGGTPALSASRRIATLALACGGETASKLVLGLA